MIIRVTFFRRFLEFPTFKLQYKTYTPPPGSYPGENVPGRIYAGEYVPEAMYEPSVDRWVDGNPVNLSAWDTAGELISLLRCYSTAQVPSPENTCRLRCASLTWTAGSRENL